MLKTDEYCGVKSQSNMHVFHIMYCSKFKNNHYTRLDAQYTHQSTASMFGPSIIRFTPEICSSANVQITTRHSKSSNFPVGKSLKRKNNVSLYDSKKT